MLAKNSEAGLFWARMLNFGAVFIPIFFSHWCLTFLDIEKEKKNRIILTLGYLVTLVFALFAFTPYYVSHVEPKLFFPYWPMPGVLHPFYLLFCWGGMLGYSVYHLWRNYQRSSGYKQAQTKYILIGTLLGFGGGATNFLLWYGVSIAPWGNPLVAAWSIILSYTILHYRFMDIKVILTELLVGVMGVILLILPLLMPMSSLKILTITIFILFCVFGYYLIKATREEAKRREDAEKLAIQERTLKEEAGKLVKQETEMREKAEKMALREKILKEEIGKIALQEKKLAETQKEIVEERTTRLGRLSSLILEKELTIEELKRKIRELEKK